MDRPTSRAEWRARTTEPVIDPDLAICDPHHHLWVHPPMAVPPSGTQDEAAAREDRYLLDELLADTGAGHRVLETVFVECGSAYRDGRPARAAARGETEFVEAAAQGGGAPAAATPPASPGSWRSPTCAGARPSPRCWRRTGRRAAGASAASATRCPGTRALRSRNHRTDPVEGLLVDPGFQEGVRALGRAGLTYDVWLYHPQLPEAGGAGPRGPDTTIVVDHLGGPLGVGPYAGRPRRGARRLPGRRWRSWPRCPTCG